MAFAKTYLHILKAVADATPLPQSFFDNSNRTFEPILTIVDGEEVLVERSPSNTTITVGLESNPQTKGLTKVYTEDETEMILVGIPNLNQWEMLDILELWTAYGDGDFQALLSHSETMELIKSLDDED